MRAATAIVIALLGGCNQIFGLSPPQLADGGGLDAGVDGPCGDPLGLPDEDGDGVRDPCDNCPHVAQVVAAEFLDPDGDGIGVVCDPRIDATDRVVAFFAFATPVSTNAITLVVDPSAGSWSYQAGALAATGTTPGTDMIARIDVSLAAVTIDVDVTLPASVPMLPKSQSHSLGVWADVLPPPQPAPYDPTFPPGVVLELFEGNGVSFDQRAHLVDTSTNLGDVTGSGPEWFVPAARYRLVLTCEGDGGCRGEVRRGGTSLGVLNLPMAGRVGSVGLRSYGVDGRFHHVMVYAPVP